MPIRIDCVPGSEDRAAVVPDEGGDVEEGLGPGAECWQYWLEQNGEQAEEVQRVAARLLQVVFAPCLAGQFPGFDAVDVLIGKVSESHDLTDRLAEFARFVMVGDRCPALANGLDRW